MGLVNSQFRPGALRRGLRLGRLGLSLTGSYLGYQAQNLLFGEEKRPQRQRHFQQKASRRLREELQSLKGAAMKMGQILSLQTHALPEEAIQELSNLQMRAPGMHPALARAQFKASCGRYPEEVFREFEPEPFAAASLGQVHRAITKSGEKVAVKIQYPAIRASIENDFKLFRSATLPGRLSGYAPAAVINEVQRGFLEETDYLHEARNLEFFHQGLRGLALSIPKVHPALSTDRVLTMSFIEGVGLAEFLRQKPPQALRDLIGARLVEMYYFQVHHLRALHADHHPGNYLFQSDGHIGLVDFGCVKRINFDVSDLIESCVNRAWRRGEAAASRVLKHVFGSEIPYARARTMLPTLEAFAGILYPLGNQKGGFVDFGDTKLLNTLGQTMMKAARDKLCNPEFAFISRADMGLYSLMHQLKSKVDVASIWRRVAASGKKDTD